MQFASRKAAGGSWRCLLEREQGVLLWPGGLLALQCSQCMPGTASGDSAQTPHGLAPHTCRVELSGRKHSV